MAAAMRQTVADKLKGIERYNPENLKILERYVEIQSQENSYDLEANLAVLKLYQINQNYNLEITCQILLKAITNFPHTDFVLCKCLLNDTLCKNEQIQDIIKLANLLECCEFQTFWDEVLHISGLCSKIAGFHDSIRKFVCHVVGITFQTIHASLLSKLLGKVDVEKRGLLKVIHFYGWTASEPRMAVYCGGWGLINHSDHDFTLRQWVQKYGWKELPNGLIFIANQDENIKTKNITEKIDFDNIAGIMAACR